MDIKVRIYAKEIKRNMFQLNNDFKIVLCINDIGVADISNDIYQDFSFTLHSHGKMTTDIYFKTGEEFKNINVEFKGL